MRLFRRPSHASIVAYLALFVAATGTATAATGGSFLLGKSNTANHATALSNTGSGPALQLKTHKATTPPLSVYGNSTKVSGFNADKLDGLTSSSSSARSATSTSAPPPARSTSSTGTAPFAADRSSMTP